jgi:cytochrome c oxidase cbb3-type subunit 3
MSRTAYEDYFRHDHDGITEFDNPLPGWWKWLFVASIAFSIGYVVYYGGGEGTSIEEAYDAEVVAQLERQLAGLGTIAPDDATISRLLAEHSSMISAMGGMFRANCAPCHRDDAGGNIGPNLTDDHWKSVKTPADLCRVISDGVPGTAMPVWKLRLREPQIILMAAYVASLRGTSPANPKSAEGQAIPPWPQAGDGGGQSPRGQSAGSSASGPSGAGGAPPP